jgi:hypothetical protein
MLKQPAGQHDLLYLERLHLNEVTLGTYTYWRAPAETMLQILEDFLDTLRDQLGWAPDPELIPIPIPIEDSPEDTGALTRR